MSILNNRSNTFRLYLALFAKIFSEIHVTVPKENGIYMKRVPIHFGPSMQSHRSQDEYMKGKRVDIPLPQMGFSFLAPQFDSSRVMSRTERVMASCNDMLSIQAMPVPYTIPMVLYIKTKTVNELLEILEQILPYFSPSLTIGFEIYDYGNIQFKDDVVLTLTSSTERLDNWESEEKRDIEWQVDFDMKAYLFRQPQGNYLNYPLVDSNDNVLENDTEITQSNIITSFTLNSGTSPIVLNENNCIDLDEGEVTKMFGDYESMFVG